MFASKFPSTLAATVTIMCFVVACHLPITTAQAATMNTTQSQAANTSNIQTRSPPPAKSLFNSQLFQSDNLLGGVMKTFVNSLPIRESYIAFEQAHPADTSSSQEYDQYFKPSKFPGLVYDQPSPTSYYTRLQNSYSYAPPSPPHLSSSGYYQPQQSPYYMPFSPQLPPPPPPPPLPPSQPFLRLVKIPGDLKITVSGGGRNDLEVICEFPPYILIVQQIYWHVIPPPSSLLLPYGTFYDSRNGFAPRVTVTSISKWKSVLTVRDYTTDDYGTYRCVSTAILPDEPEPTYSVQLPHLPPTPPSFFPNFPHHHDSLEYRSAASTVSLRQLEDNRTKENGDTMTTGESQNRARKIKFVRRKREIGAFGVHAPFFKPLYGIYRVFKEIKFYGEPFGLGSDIVENTLGGTEILDKVTSSNTGGNNAKGMSRDGREDKQHEENGGRRFDLFTRRSKVLF